MHASSVSLAVLHGLVIAAFTWARIARDGALLSRVAVEWVPWLTVLILAVTVLASPLVAWMARQDPARAFVRLAVATGLSLVAWEWLLRRSEAWSALVLYVWVGAYGPVLVAQFWVLVQARLDPRQARQHIGWIGAAGIVGGIVAGLLASVMASRAGLGDLVGLTVLAHLGAGTIAMGWQGATPAAAARVDATALRARTLLREAGYARLLAFVVVLGALTGGLVDYQFKRALQQQSTDASALGTWLGVYNVAVGALALVAQLATPLLLARSGARLVAFVLPSGVLAGAVAGAAWPAAPWPAAGTRLWEHAARISLGRTAHEFFFLPFQGQARVVMKHAAEGFLTRGGEVLASLVLVGLAASGRADGWHLALAVGISAGAWLVHVGWLGRAYGPALSLSLDQLLRPGRADTPAHVDRGVTVSELVALLRSPDSRHVTFALDELAAIDPERARHVARPLVTHGSRHVRLRARRVLMPARPARTNGTSWTGAQAALSAALTTGDPARAAAACAEVTAAVDRAAVPVLLGHLSGATRMLVRDTLVTLGDAVAGSLGDALVDDRVPARVRRDLAQVLARIASPAALAQLTRVPEDAPRALRGLALRGLDAARKRGLDVPVDPAAAREALSVDVRDFERRRRHRATAASGSGPEWQLLARAVGEAAHQARERVFRRLALLYPAREMLRAHRGLASDDPRIAAFAVEYLEATLTPEHREQVLPVLVTPPDDDPMALDALLLELLRDEDPWIAAIAAHACGARRDRALAPALQAVDARDPVHAEALAWAMGRL
ncbi:hypothetical protein TBR22_A11600 [Luteitalea sp. TBR-22]|uniref:hypothetical protein n=1 Tax=Luteitalea sp. TBR-22 TaxID=2802971 RepID=UPI001EF4ECD6|nr:hypothetical protein [Luteitalea sp. TBR-22]BCS31956.2 hypothetical protein TBR22_A11600 [Luteitalea sp. TBR-22]